MDSSPCFPLELLERVVDLSESYRVLTMCSRTCKALVPASQRRLFHTVTLRAKHQIQAFNATLVETSRLSSYVIHLGFVDLDIIDNVIEPTVSILSILTGQIKTVSLLRNTSWGCEWKRLHSSIQDALVAVTRGPNFEGVDCQLYQLAVPTLSRLSSIRHLELYYPVQNYFGVQIPSPHLLKSLRISFCNTHDAALQHPPFLAFSGGQPLLDLSKVERLIIDPTLHKLPGASRAWAMPSKTEQWISLLGKMCASSLVELYWELGSCDRKAPTLLLNDLPRLSSLNVGFSYERESPTCERRCSPLIHWLTTRSPLPPIHSLNFSFPIEDASSESLEAFILAIPEYSCGNITIGFFHHIWEREEAESVDCEHSFHSLQLAAGMRERRNDSCMVRIVNPKESFGSWIELRTQRPYGHILG
ncbi:hypothetical protein DL96DRAFT_1638194 [Flagelloscypha sp. PMI_526]|nr:hypothetical protein DL96DRAFT_1638194 [Flagelloscypha sp. PMI_526]